MKPYMEDLAGHRITHNSARKIFLIQLRGVLLPGILRTSFDTCLHSYFPLF